MRIALIRRRYSAIGGAELYLQRLMLGLQKGGHELHLYTETWHETPENLHLHKIRAVHSRSRGYLHFAEEVKKTLAKEDYDCVFSLERTYQQDVYRAGDGVHRVWLEKRRQFSPLWRRLFIGRSAFHRNLCALERLVFSPLNTGRIIVNSEMVRHQIVHGFNYPEERIHLVRNGVDLSRFKPGNKDAARQKYGLQKDDFVLLFVGTGWERKGLRYLCNEVLPAYNSTLKGQPPAKLLVIGKGKQRGYNQTNVCFFGPDRAIEQAYHAADLFTFLPIYEPSANVCAEALACQLPVLTTKDNGASEIIREGRTGTVLNSATCIEAAVRAIQFWRDRKGVPIEVEREDLSLEHNVQKTIEVLQLAAERPRVLAPASS